MTRKSRPKTFMRLACFILCFTLSYTNVQAQRADIQGVCDLEHNELIDHRDSGEWDKVYQLVGSVRACARNSAVTKARIEHTYVMEVQALAEMKRYDDVIATMKDILESHRIVERRDYLSFVLEYSALAANNLGRTEESLHLLNLALYDSEARGILATTNLQRSIYLLQKRNREYDAAGETIDEIKTILEERGSELPIEERFVTYAMMSESYYARLIPKTRQGAGALDTTRSDVSDLWAQARLYHQQSHSILSKINLDEAKRDDLVHRMRILDLDVARLLDHRETVSRLLAEWQSEAREKRAPSRLLHGLATQARVEMDQEAYDRALNTIGELEEAARDYQLRSFLPRVFSYRVRVASHTGDRLVAQRALDDLAGFEGSVPAQIFREASGQYASVFETKTTPTGFPNWMLLCLSLGIAGTLQYIVVTGSRPQKARLFRAVASPIMHLVRGGHWEIPPALLGKTAQQGASVSVNPAATETATPPAEASVDAKDNLPTPAGGDGFALAAEDAAWLKEVGVTVQDVPEIDAPPEVDPATLEDLLQQSLDASTRIRCFGPDGTKTNDMPLPVHVIEHATSDRFIGIELDDRLLIVYRYARPQHTMVKQDETGALRIVELDTPVIAVPIASIQKEA
jgi:hypothetical protein